MSWTLSTNSGSLESLNVSWRCGCSPNARQIRDTAVCVSPTSLDIERVDQCVGDRPRPPRPRLITEPGKTMLSEAVAPLAHRADRDVQSPGDLCVVGPLGRRQ